jgi:hypothetical protein
MAKRYSGSLQINVVYDDHGHYRTSVSSGGKLLWRGTVNPAPVGFGPGVAYDSPQAYDKIASSAIAFADDEVGGIADEAEYDENLTGYLIRRKPPGKSTSSHARKKIDPHEAKQRLEAAGIDFSRDFHTLPSREVDLILEAARAAGYRKSKDAPGSTARMYFQYLSRLTKGGNRHATSHEDRTSRRPWSGMCPTGKHGLDFKGQSCDLCKKTPPAQLKSEIKRALASRGIKF